MTIRRSTGSLLGLLILFGLLLTACAPTPAAQEPAGPVFQGVAWGETAVGIIQAAQSEDFFLVSEGTFAGLTGNRFLGFDKEGNFISGGYAFSSGPQTFRDDLLTVKGELTALYGEPKGAVYQDGTGASADGLDAALESGGWFQILWMAPDRAACYLQPDGENRFLLLTAAPGLEAGGTDGGFEDIPWRTPVSQVVAQADWSTWLLAQPNALVGDIPSRAIYRFDEAGAFVRGEYWLDRNQTLDQAARTQAAVSLLAELYDIQAAESDISEMTQWQAAGGVISAQESQSGIVIVIQKEAQ